jgi:hypothetical protein
MNHPVKKIVLPVKIDKTQYDSDSSVEYRLYDATGRLIAEFEWDEQGKSDIQVVVDLFNNIPSQI